MEETKEKVIEEGGAFEGVTNEEEYKEKVVEKKPMTWGVKALRVSIFILVIWAILFIVTSVAKIWVNLS